MFRKTIQLVFVAAFIALGAALMFTNAKANHPGNFTLVQHMQPVVGQRLVTPLVCLTKEDVVQVNLGFVESTQKGIEVLTQAVNSGRCLADTGGWTVQVIDVDPTLYIQTDDDIGYVIMIVPWGRSDVTPRYSTVFVRSPEANGTSS